VGIQSEEFPIVHRGRHWLDPRDRRRALRHNILLKENYDETLPIINKSKHPKKGEYQEQNERTHVQEGKSNN
jgi:hypothetical protein